MVCKMMLPQFEFYAPTNLDAVCSLLAEAGTEGAILAGGTDLLVKMKRGVKTPRVIVSLAKIDDCTKIQAPATGDQTWTIGSSVTMRQLEQHAGLWDNWTSLAEGASSVGGPLIRNRATVGGNIVNARPCADTVSPLISLGAQLFLKSTKGVRKVALEDFIVGPGQTQLKPGEIVTEIALSSPGNGDSPWGSCYQKITRRAVMEVTIVGCAAFVLLDKTRTVVEKARIVLTSVAPLLLRMPEAEKVILGKAPEPALLQKAGAVARSIAKPISDHRAPADYRSELIEVLVKRALSKAVQRARNQRLPLISNGGTL